MDGLDNMTTSELRSFMSDMGLSYRHEDGSRMKKSEMIEAIQGTTEAPAEEPKKESAPAMPPPPKVEAEPAPAPAPPKPAPKPKAAPAPKPEGEFFKVIGKHRYCDKNGVHRLNHGSVVSAKTHNMEALRAQKVRMEPCDPPGWKPDSFGRLPDREFAPVKADPRLSKPEEPVMFGTRDGRGFYIDSDGNRKVIVTAEENEPGSKARPFRVGAKVV